MMLWDNHTGVTLPELHARLRREFRHGVEIIRDVLVETCDAIAWIWREIRNDVSFRAVVFFAGLFVSLLTVWGVL